MLLKSIVRQAFKVLTPERHLRQFRAYTSACAGNKEKFGLPKRLEGSGTNVWNQYGALLMEYNPINLAHGYPEDAPPYFISEALVKTAYTNNPLLHQYPRGSGHVRLVKAIAKLYSGILNRKIDPLTDVLVTFGAFEALFDSILGHVDDGDEVIIMEPFFECYQIGVKMAGGIPRLISLRPQKTDGSLSSGDFKFDDNELECLFNEKTKMIILNTPHNPLGKVFKRDELEKIAALCKKWNVLCVSDEVYEWLVYDCNEHIRICTLPGMWERTITIGSAGKTFAVTGWKHGWAIGPDNLLNNLRLVHQTLTYTCATPIQEALAIAFEHELQRLNSPDCFFNSLPRDLKGRRDFMAKSLSDAGMRPIIPEGGYFMMADWSSLKSKIDLSSEKDKYADLRFTKWMAKNLGILAIPPSVFYSDANKSLGENYVRYCFTKKQENLEKAAELLKKLKK